MRRLAASSAATQRWSTLPPSADHDRALATIRLVQQNEDYIVAPSRLLRVGRGSECHLVTGQRDYLLKVAASGLGANMSASSRKKIARLKCVASIETSFIMSTIKERRI